MFSALVFAGLLQTASPSQEQRNRPSHPPITVGWHDEMNDARVWSPSNVENKARVSVPTRGAVRLDLGQVPEGWPYEYQWSGITRRATVDLARFPYLSAWVSHLLGGYAHMDIDVLDAKGKAVKGFRSSTLKAGGITAIDLSTVLDPAIYTLQIRLIVGGSNQGCWATYDWVRFTSPADGALLKGNPGWRWIRESKAAGS
jgi:hypothetical protein